MWGPYCRHGSHPRCVGIELFSKINFRNEACFPSYSGCSVSQLCKFPCIRPSRLRRWLAPRSPGCDREFLRGRRVLQLYWPCPSRDWADTAVPRTADTAQPFPAGVIADREADVRSARVWTYQGGLRRPLRLWHWKLLDCPEVAQSTRDLIDDEVGTSDERQHESLCWKITCTRRLDRR